MQKFKIFSSDFQTLVKLLSPLYFVYKLLMSLRTADEHVLRFNFPTRHNRVASYREKKTHIVAVHCQS